MASRTQSPPEILDIALHLASEYVNEPLISDSEIVSRIELIARNTQNRAGARFILACALAKQHRPQVDIRKPNTEIGDEDAFSGRTYDERYLTEFIVAHDLPCNATTAFLTPALRNRNNILTPEVNLVGRPAGVYKAMLLLLDDVYMGKITAKQLLAETLRWLVLVRDEKRQRMATLLATLKSSQGETTLAAEEIVNLIDQHLKLKGGSRLPVLVVAAAYQAAQSYLGERVLPPYGHLAADKQTGSLGDLEVVLVDDARLVTSYEMKTRQVTKDDIDLAIAKIVQNEKRIDNYLFITTERIEPEVQDYASEIYGLMGVELVILDCIGFLRHFLHLFYRLRLQFLEAYQALLLAEPESAVRQPLKEAFLALRQAAESVDL